MRHFVDQASRMFLLLACRERKVYGVELRPALEFFRLEQLAEWSFH